MDAKGPFGDNVFKNPSRFRQERLNHTVNSNTVLLPIIIYVTLIQLRYEIARKSDVVDKLGLKTVKQSTTSLSPWTKKIACEHSRLSSLFPARNVPRGEERERRLYSQATKTKTLPNKSNICRKNPTKNDFKYNETGLSVNWARI